MGGDGTQPRPTTAGPASQRSSVVTIDRNDGHDAGALRANDRLDSWKEIAAYLNKEVRTVQRWEKNWRLPVRRLAQGKQGTVFAYKAGPGRLVAGKPDAEEVRRDGQLVRFRWRRRVERWEIARRLQDRIELQKSDYRLSTLRLTVCRIPTLVSPARSLWLIAVVRGSVACAFWPQIPGRSPEQPRWSWLSARSGI